MSVANVRILQVMPKLQLMPVIYARIEFVKQNWEKSVNLTFSVGYRLYVCGVCWQGTSAIEYV